MKKFIKTFLIGILGFLGLAVGVSADTPPEEFNVWNVEPIEAYVPGLEGWYKPVNDTVVYCLEEGLTYIPNTTYKLNSQIDDGYIYIIESKPNTGDERKDYYIKSIAVWWYKDYLNNNNRNISEATKNYIIEHKDTDEVCKKIYELVEGAKKYKQKAGSFTIDTKNVNFKEDNGYYISDKITVTGSNITSVKDIKLTASPKDSTIINKSVNAKGNGTFQIKVPVSSLKNGESYEIKFTIDGTYAVKKVFDYVIKYKPNKNINYQDVAYGQIFSDPKDVSKTGSITIKRADELKVRISKTDITGEKEVPGATLVLKGENGFNKSWVSTNEPHYEVLEPGIYTLTETIAPKGYILNTTTITFKLNEDNTVYEKDSKGNWVKVDYIKMINEKELTVRISKTDITGEKEIPGATLVLKGENGFNKSWVSTNEPHYEVLKAGIYTLTETIAPKGYILNTTTITFKLDNDGNVYEKNATGEFVKVDYIKMINLVKPAINISKLDIDTNEYVGGAELVIKNLKGEIIASWTTSNESHYVALEEGEYVLEEVKAPYGYILNSDPVYFKVDNDGNLFVKDANGNYTSTNGLIIYNKMEEIEIPATGLNSTITYALGTITLTFGAIMLYKNEKKYQINN